MEGETCVSYSPFDALTTRRSACFGGRLLGHNERTRQNERTLNCAAAPPPTPRAHGDRAFEQRRLPNNRTMPMTCDLTLPLAPGAICCIRKVIFWKLMAKRHLIAVDQVLVDRYLCYASTHLPRKVLTRRRRDSDRGERLRGRLRRSR